jgi:hypothetical protein
MHSANPSYHPKIKISATKTQGPQTFVRTAIDANEFPKVMPTTGAYAETTSMGASAVPFGIGFGAIYNTNRRV